MTITLKPELQAFIDAQIRAGVFQTEVHALESAIEQMMLNIEPSALDLAAIERAEAEYAKGDTLDFRDASDALLKKQFSAGLGDE